MKHGTNYEEAERELKLSVLDRFGINPWALALVVRSYKDVAGGEPVSITVQMDKKDEKMDKRGPTVGFVEIHIMTPGFLAKKTGKMKGPLDMQAVKLLAHSYYSHVRPLPVGFYFDGLEFQFRTPGVAEDDHKNIARNVYNPFEKIVPKSPGR